MKRLKIFAILFAISLTFLDLSYAAQSNFSVSPPPIASPDFEAGKGEGRLTAIYIGMKGQGFEMTGGGVNFIYRKAISDIIALDGSAGAIGIGGTAGSGQSASDITVGVIPLSINIEFQLTKGLILYGGLPYMFSAISIEIPGPSNDIFSDTTLTGYQGGAQYGINTGDFKITPFVMFQSLGGKTTTTIGSQQSTSTTIPSYTVTSYGLDVLYVPWNVTLSSLLQQAAKTGNNEAIKTTIIQLSWNF